MSASVIRFQDIDTSKVMLVGGKGAQLGELRRMDGIEVPDGFCITTTVFQNMMMETPRVQELLSQLSGLTLGHRAELAAASVELRAAIQGAIIPPSVRDEVAQELHTFGVDDAYAIRSSATAEDLPNASFAGQQDSFLNVIGLDAICRKICECWASLFTERAIVYRLQNGFEHHAVSIAVVVQKMVHSQVSGVMFTADPVSFNRKVVSIDACFGLGEALVSGLVNADVYRVREGRILEQKPGLKRIASHGEPTGGTRHQSLPEALQTQPSLTEEQVLRLERLGRQIEAGLGSPQDIEWCLVNDRFYVVQSRPITTLFPIPPAPDAENRAYISVGHQQMMTDPMLPMGLSFYLLTTRAPMRTAGGRLFVDVTQLLKTSASRTPFFDMLGKSAPLFREALLTVLERGDFIQTQPDAQTENGAKPGTPSAQQTPAPADFDPAIIAELRTMWEQSNATLKQEIQSKTGSELLDFILADIQRLKQLTFEPRSAKAIMIAIDAAAWINERVEAWLGEKNVADTVSLSVSGNITSEMGMRMLDIADLIRPYPALVAYLEQVTDDHFMAGLLTLEGGAAVHAALTAFLDKYGMRGVGEIDVSRPRWRETPSVLIPMILSNVKNAEAGASAQRFQAGLQKALHKEQSLLAQLRQLPDGEAKASEVKRVIHIIRTISGFREYPKYGMINRFTLYRQALLEEGERLVAAQILARREDLFYLHFEELQEVVRAQSLDQKLIQARKAAYAVYTKLQPPIVITSEGEAISGRYQREDVPAGALIGLGVSGGIIEGRARVIREVKEAHFEPGDILVTAFTDPSWTPVFVSIAGLVTEVGGLVTHGAVIAREYGLPAVVAVNNATRLIQEGQRIRLNGRDGYVELL